MSNLENNKLIAEFMGCRECSQKLFRVADEFQSVTIYSEYQEEDEYLTIEAGKRQIKYTPEEMKYYTSWDWLMPVVEEIHTYGCEVVISSNGVTTIYAPSGEVLAEESSEEDDHMHDATYKAIVKVLKENLHKPCQ